MIIPEDFHNTLLTHYSKIRLEKDKLSLKNNAEVSVHFSRRISECLRSNNRPENALLYIEVLPAIELPALMAL